MRLNPSQELELYRLKRAFRSRLPERVQAIQATAEQAFGADGTAKQARVPLERLLHQTHRLCGSSAIFGFSAVSQAAHGLENALRGILEGDSKQVARAAIETIRRLEALKAALRREGLASPSPRIDGGVPAASLLDRESAAPTRLLLVDDDDDTLALLRFRLEEAGLRVTTARSGNEALAHVRQCPPDIVVADAKMDGMSGYELCRLIHEMGLTDLPFVLCSAAAEPSERIAGLSMGADDYLPKPFDPAELVLKLRRWTSRKGGNADRSQPRVDRGLSPRNDRSPGRMSQDPPESAGST